AGIAALILAAHPGYDNDRVAELLLDTADSIDGVNQAKYAGNLGAGRVNALSALTIDPLTIIPHLDASALPGEGATVAPLSTITFGLPDRLASDGMKQALVGSPQRPSFELIRAGYDNTFGTNDDVTVTLNVASKYRVGSNDFSLNTAGGLLAPGKYRL